MNQNSDSFMVSSSQQVPGRPGSTWRKALLVLLVLASCVALFYGVENYRGWRAWKREEARLRQAGEPLTWRELLSPAPPDEENLAAAPVYAELFEAMKDCLTAPGLSDRHEAITRASRRAKIDLELPGYRIPGGGVPTWYRGLVVDMEAIANAYRHPDRPDWVERPVPVAPEGARAEEQVLMVLGLYDEQFRAIEEAARRPRAWFPVRYEDGFNALLPHLAVLRSHIHALVLRGLCHLRQGRPEAAFRDYMTARRLVAALEEEPLLISQMVRWTEQMWTLQVPWEAMVTGAWDREQWRACEAELARVDFRKDLARAIFGERISVLSTLESLRRSRDTMMAAALPEQTDRTVVDWTVRLMPDGWIWQNMARLSRFYSSALDLAAETHRSVPDWNALEGLEEPVRKGRGGVYDFLVKLVGPSIVQCIRRAVTAQTGVNLARTAIHLEFYRLEHGEYPETLAFPGGTPGWALDPWDGQPLRYRRESPRSFLLYSVGWNRQDDQGEPPLSRHPVGGNRSLWGDLVWRVPALAGPDSSTHPPHARTGPR